MVYGVLKGYMDGILMELMPGGTLTEVLLKPPVPLDVEGEAGA